MASHDAGMRLLPLILGFLFGVVLFTGGVCTIRREARATVGVNEAAEAACTPYRYRILDGAAYCLRADGAWVPAPKPVPERAP